MKSKRNKLNSNTFKKRTLGVIKVMTPRVQQLKERKGDECE